MDPIRVLVADDHAVVREGLRQLLEMQSDITVIGEACDGIEALELARQLKPDVVLLDIAMPRLSGLEAVSLIRDAVPQTRIVVLSMYEKEAYAHHVVQAGAYGYVLKGEPSSDMLTAIRYAHAGRYYFSKKVNVEGLQNDWKEQGQESDSTDFNCLSGREKEVFFLLIEGNSTLQIADILCRSPKTVEKHRTSISKKLGVGSPVEMMKVAIRCGVVDPACWKK